MPSRHEDKIMAKLTDTQLIMLSNASARDDGIAVDLPKMNKAAALKVGASLVARKLMRELRSKPGMPVWREDDDGRSVSLMIYARRARSNRRGRGQGGEASAFFWQEDRVAIAVAQQKRGFKDLGIDPAAAERHLGAPRFKASAGDGDA
jgi:hypothetical protein